MGEWWPKLEARFVAESERPYNTLMLLLLLTLALLPLLIYMGRSLAGLHPITSSRLCALPVIT